MAAAYQLGYRIAIMVASAGALWIAADHGWMAAYTAMAAMVGVGIVTTLLIPEPEPRVARESLAQEERVVAWLERKAHWPESMQQLGSWFVGAVVCPFVDFFTRYGTRLALLMLAFIASYRLTDFTMGVMANPVLPRRGLHAEADRGGRQGLRSRACRSSARCSAASPWPGSAP